MNKYTFYAGPLEIQKLARDSQYCLGGPQGLRPRANGLGSRSACTVSDWIIPGSNCTSEDWAWVNWVYATLTHANTNTHTYERLKMNESSRH